MLINKWYKLFDQCGCICKGKSPGRRPVTEAQVDTVRAAFVRRPRKSTRRATRLDTAQIWRGRPVGWVGCSQVLKDKFIRLV
jgi:hypothetical protein